MGKLTLLLVLAAVVGGSVLTMSMQSTAGFAARGQAENQADLLARQIAESGQSVVLTEMMDLDGFKDPGLTSHAYDDGRFDVTYVPAADRQRATVTVKGYYGGAVHTIESRYEFDPMTYPGPIWLDVPYATSQVTGSPSVSGGPQNLAVQFDPRRHDDLGLQSALPLSGLANDFGPDMRLAGSSFRTPGAGSWAGLLEDLNVSTADDLYQVALAAMGPGDRVYPGARTITSSLTAMGPTAITRIGGSLTVAGGAVVTGEGVLLVEGGLVVEPGARLTWTGLVVVRSTEDSLPIQLDGAVAITGGLVVAQDAVPPGGHLDVTVFQNRSGISAGNPAGDTNGSWATPTPGVYPWYEHTHQFEQNVSTTRQVVFAQQSSDPQEAHLKFREALTAAGSQNVYLEFRNPTVHGHARYRLDVQGLGGVAAGTVRNGFADPFRQAGRPFRSATFRADQLRDFSLDVRSLRALKQRFDGSGCQVWPFCIGGDAGRKGALTVRLVRVSGNKPLYEAALYWHMREDEVAQHLADEQAWRAQVASGTGFGTHLRMGGQTRVAFAVAPIVRLRERLGFDGNEVRLVSSTTSHATTRDTRAALPTP